MDEKESGFLFLGEGLNSEKKENINVDSSLRGLGSDTVRGFRHPFTIHDESIWLNQNFSTFTLGQQSEDIEELLREECLRIGITRNQVVDYSVNYILGQSFPSSLVITDVTWRR